MTYIRARFYEPSSGRFITKDSVRDGFNWYSYCNGNPVGYVDWSGEEPATIGIVLLGSLILLGVWYVYVTHPEHREDFSRALNDMCRDLTKSPIELKYNDLGLEMGKYKRNPNDDAVQEIDRYFREHPITGSQNHQWPNFGKNFKPDPDDPFWKKIMKWISIIGGEMFSDLADVWENKNLTPKDKTFE